MSEQAPRTDADACQAEPRRPMTADEVDHQWRNWCEIEVMVRNASVNERISTLEADLATAQAKIAALESDIARHVQIATEQANELETERRAREEAEDSARVCGILFWDVIHDFVPHSQRADVDKALQNNATGKANALLRVKAVIDRAEAAEARLAAAHKVISRDPLGHGFERVTVEEVHAADLLEAELAGMEECAQIAFDTTSDDPQPGDWNAACEHIQELILAEIERRRAK